MIHPTFDSSRDPTVETCLAISQWPTDDCPGLLAYLKEAWGDDGYVSAELDLGGATIVQLVTGGSSGNQMLVGAMERTAFWDYYWQSSHRGGLHVFRIPKETVNP